MADWKFWYCRYQSSSRVELPDNEQRDALYARFLDLSHQLGLGLLERLCWFASWLPFFFWQPQIRCSVEPYSKFFSFWLKNIVFMIILDSSWSMDFGNFGPVVFAPSYLFFPIQFSIRSHCFKLLLGGFSQHLPRNINHLKFV